MQTGLRVITLQGAIEKIPILLSQYWENEWLEYYFGGSNNIFADYNYHSKDFIVFYLTDY